MLPEYPCYVRIKNIFYELSAVVSDCGDGGGCDFGVIDVNVLRRAFKNDEGRVGVEG